MIPRMDPQDGSSLLCRLGLHRWRVSFYGARPLRRRRDCERCGLAVFG